MLGRAGRHDLGDRGIENSRAGLKDGTRYLQEHVAWRFRSSFNMLLNLMRVDGVDPEYLLRASPRYCETIFSTVGCVVDKQGNPVREHSKEAAQTIIVEVEASSRRSGK